MGARMPILRRVSSTLSTALLEWILMLLLFIDAVYSFLVARFARLCKLPAPCPFCSRLDHVLGNEKPCFYRELICKTHKSEISSLAFCRLHQKLARAQSMCEGCWMKANDDDKTDGPVMDVDVFDGNQEIDDGLNSPHASICSCCGQRFKQRSVRLFSRKIAELEPTEAFDSPNIYTDYSVECHLDESLEPKDIYHQSDHHERQSLLQMTSDSDVEIPCPDDRSSHPHEAVEIPCTDDSRSSHPHQANVMEDLQHEHAAFELPIFSYPEVVKESERNIQTEVSCAGSHDISSAYFVDDHPDSGINGDLIEANDSSAQHGLLVKEKSGLKDADISQCLVASSGELPQPLGETEPCQSRSESNVLPYTSQFTVVEQHYAVSVQRNIEDNLERVHGPEITATSIGEFHQRIELANDKVTTESAPQNTHHVASEDADNAEDIRVSQSSADSENIGEIEDCTKKIEAAGGMGTHDLTDKDPSDTATKDFVEKDYADEAHISADAVKSSAEIPQDHSGAEEYRKTSESAVERRPSLNTQISMNEAYRLAIGSKNSLTSPTLTDVILGKDSTSGINEELRLLLSQLSASRGLEAPWVDPGPSPRAYGRGDELVVQNITQRISLDRNASGLESLDGSIVSEMEGESTIDRLRRQIDLDRKSIHLLCRELEEERNASAIATSQALAMITKLQDEKAAMQMEASHYQRMMEEQAEYDSEALAKANELLAEREQQIEELEAELENYRRQFGGGPIEKHANQALLEGGTECPVITTTRGTDSLVSFEEERAYIATCLRQLEQKLESYSNNSTFVYLSHSDVVEDEFSSEASVVEDNSSHRQESSCMTEDHTSLGMEAGSSMSREVDLTTIQKEIATLNRRLKTLEGDHNFLEHSINSLRNGDEGLIFIREIACDLRKLRTVAIDKK